MYHSSKKILLLKKDQPKATVDPFDYKRIASTEFKTT